MPTIIPIPAFADNYIWLLRHDAKAAVVDPGDAAPVIEHLEHEGIELCAIVNTHHHGDHVGGNRGLLARWPVPVFGPAREQIPGRTRALGEGDTFTLPGIGLELSVLDIPGHTSGHIACVGRDVVFCGDTLFAAGCGRLFEGTPAQMLSSLDKLAALPPGTRVYCGHEYTVSNLRFALAVEPQSAALRARLVRDQAKRDRGEPTLPSTIGEEGETNPFLRTSDAAVRAAAVRHAGRDLPIAWRYSPSFAPGRTHSDDIRHAGRDLPDLVAILVGASRVEEGILTMSGTSGAICPIAWPCWPELRAWKNAL